MTYVPYEDIPRSLDLHKGDILLVSSDITHLSWISHKHNQPFDPNRFISALQDVLTPKGTLLFPTFNWGFCRGQAFDLRQTTSETGALSKAALQRSDFVRTQHPIYSFAAWGQHAQELQRMNNISSFGADSPFAFLHRSQAKNLLIGVDYQDSFTFVHYVEELEKVPYRFQKPFTAAYVDLDGKTSQRTYSMFVRNHELGLENAINPIGKVMEKKGISKVMDINGIPFILVQLGGAFDEIQQDIRENGGKKLWTQSPSKPS
jgi:aminoglycoside 3-N-acetyltransferase